MLIALIMSVKLIDAFKDDKLKSKKLMKCEDKIDEKDFSND